MKRWIGIALVALLASVSTAHADDASPFAFDQQLEVGIFAGLFLPSDDHEFYDWEKASHSALKSVGFDVGLRLGYSPIPVLAVELEGNLIPTSTDPGGDKATLLGLRGQLLGQYPVGDFTPFVALGGGVMGVFSKNNVLGTDADRVVHAGLGAKFKLHQNFSLRAGFRVVRAPEAMSEKGWTNHTELLLAGTFHFGRGAAEEVEKDEPEVLDRDQDGVPDADDKCPDAAGPAPKGCPDSDGDGMDDEADACPQKPETVNEFEDEDGCPDEIADTDGDGLNDRKDSCPHLAEDKDNFNDDDGCPDIDNDIDGVLDAADGCPMKAGPMENRGCPDTDRDGDTVVDRLDNCPDEAGTVKNHGCKKKQLVVISSSELKILDKVYFASGKATIRKRSFLLLDQVARVIAAHPEIPKVVVEGHTDDRGKDDFNMDLSQRRAESVANYLSKKGVTPERLEAKGWGETKPLGPNNSRKNRAANRRVEFRIVQPAAKTKSVPAP